MAMSFGPRIIKAKGLQLLNSARLIDGTGFPISGTSGTGVNGLDGPAKGSIYHDNTGGVMFVNEGTAASPYWTPIAMDQRGIAGINTDFTGGVGRLGTATTAESYDAGIPGLRYFGTGVEENDATNTVQAITYPLGGPLLTMITENQANKLTALGYGFTTALWKPATNGTMVIDVNFTGITDILTRSIFCGFTGESASAMKPPVAGNATTLTFEATGTEGDNVHGLFMDSRLTAASTLFLATNKADAAATQTAAAAALTVAGVVPAAATYVRLRVEITAAGVLIAFVNKVQVKRVADAVATTVALSPAFGQANTTTTATLSLGVRNFGCWAAR